MKHLITSSQHDENTYLVTVRDEQGGESTHTVTIPPGYARELGVDSSNEAAKQDLLERSFRFLLEREPKDSIMQTFDLPTIERYFPEYPEIIKSM
jgi:hypothetical protein